MWVAVWMDGWLDGRAGEEVTWVDSLSESEESESGKECSSSGEYETGSSQTKATSSD